LTTTPVATVKSATHADGDGDVAEHGATALEHVAHRDRRHVRKGGGHRVGRRPRRPGAVRAVATKVTAAIERAGEKTTKKFVPRV